MKDSTCDMLLAGIHATVDIAPPAGPFLRLKHRVFTVDGEVLADTPLVFVEVTNGLWNVRTLAGGSGGAVFMVHPDEVGIIGA